MDPCWALLGALSAERWPSDVVERVMVGRRPPLRNHRNHRKPSVDMVEPGRPPPRPVGTPPRDRAGATCTIPFFDTVEA